MSESEKYLLNSKIKYTLNGLKIIGIILLFLVIINFFLNRDDILIFLLASVLMLVSYYLIKTTNKVKPTAYLLLTIGYILLFFHSTFSYRGEHLLDFAWIINISLVGFYLISRKAGVVFLTLSVFTLVVVKILIETGYLLNESYIDENAFNIYDFSINIIIVTSIMSYLLYQILSVNESSRIELIKYSDRIVEQNAEKTVMIKEIHHRVKNNLQVITSLLRLQLHKIDDVRIKEPFQETIDRISTMALIHSKMYQGESFLKLDLKSYLEDLSNDLKRNYPTKHPININIESSVYDLNLNYLVPFSLIINELVTNSIKHGFKNILDGVINIKIDNDQTILNLYFKDNGTWVKPKDEESFGMELIETLTEQFDGSFERTIDNGTYYHFKLKIIQ